MRWRLVIILSVTVAAAIGCREASEAPTARAESALRIASLSPAISIMLEDLGLTEFIIGRHGSDLSVDASIAVVGDQSGVDYEMLARVEPTHVLMQESADGAPTMLRDIAARRGWTVVSMPLLSLDEVAAGVETLAETFAARDNVSQRAEQLRERMRVAWSARPALSDHAGAVLCVYWVSPIGVAGPGSFHHDLLLRMGFDAVPTDGAAYITLDREDLKRLNPDSILILTPDIDAQALQDAMGPWRGLGVTAVERGRIAVLSDWEYLTPSTAMIDLAVRITSVVETWPARSTDDAENGDLNLQTK